MNSHSFLGPLFYGHCLLILDPAFVFKSDCHCWHLTVGAGSLPENSVHFLLLSKVNIATACDTIAVVWISAPITTPMTEIPVQIDMLRAESCTELRFESKGCGKQGNVRATGKLDKRHQKEKFKVKILKSKYQSPFYLAALIAAE